jgi:hypothetical protein
MKTDNSIRYSFIFSIVAVLIGALMRIMHVEHSIFFLAIGLLAMLTFVVTAIYEITNSTKIEGTEKFMWVVGFLFLSTITGLVYILSARKRIV